MNPTKCVDSRSGPRKLGLLSIVVPCHNEGPNTEELYQRVRKTCEGRGLPFELIFVDDSTDDTPVRIVQMHQADARVKMRRLTRSFGQSVAIFAGLKVAKGDAVIVMDSDLEDPPESIPKFVEVWKTGIDVVAARRQRTGLSPLYRILSRVFYFLAARITDLRMPANVGEFRLMDRRVVEIVNGMPECARFFRGLTLWPGFRSELIEVQREPRRHGQSNYGISRAATVALDGLLSFSFFPLRIIALAGMLLSGVTSLLTVGYFIWRLVDPKIFGQGWASLFLLLLFSTSINLLFLGIVAEYVGRIFQQVQGRPHYVVDYEIGL